MKNILSILSLALILFSCSKKDDNNPNPATSEKQELYNNVIGRWDFDVETSFRSRAAVSGKRKTSLLNKGIFSGHLSKKESSIGFLEFLSDSTYLIYDSEGSFYSGKFDVKDGTSIDLKNFGSLSDIKFSQGKIDFKISYSSPAKTIHIAANKADKVASDNRTTNLSRNWLLTKEASGDYVYEHGTEVYNEETDDWETLYFDKLTILFSQSGTYLVQYYKNGVLLSAEVANWKWHSTDSKFIYWWDTYPEDEDESSVEVLELTNIRLKLLETFEGENGLDELTYILSPL